MFSVSQFMPFCFLFVYLTMHAKDQFANPRAHLMPGFRRVHGTIFAAAAIVFALLVPAMFSWLLGWHSLGFVAISLLLFGAILWSVLLLPSSAWPMWLIMVGAVLANVEPGQSWTQQLVFGKLELQAAAILLLGAAITLLGAVRLLRLNEDMREYTWLKWDLARRRVELIGYRPAPGNRAGRAAERHVAWLTRHARRATASRWSRVCRWQTMPGVGLRVWPVAIGSVLFFEVLRRTAAQPMPLGPICFGQILFFPACASMGFAIAHGRMLAYESLRPVDRSSYVRETGMSLLSCHLRIWGVIGSVLILWLLATQQPYSPLVLANAALISAAAQLCTFGGAMWAARLGPQGIMVFGFIGALLLGAVMSSVLLFSNQWAIMFPPVLVTILAAAILAGLGLLLTWTAYRRWLTADFH